jgi:hypothetical protein
MRGMRQQARFDWLAELAGAAAIAVAGGYAALRIAPSFAWSAPGAMTGTAFAGFAAGLLAMKLVRPAPRQMQIPGFALADADAALSLEPLLLDTIYEEPLLLDDIAEDDAALLLVDALRVAEAGSRVVQLFADQPMPTPGQLKDRIDRHLAGAPRHPSPPKPVPADASQALYAALNELKRSLR